MPTVRTRTRRLVRGMTIVACGCAAVLAGVDQGLPTARTQLVAGSAWVPSTAVGQATLVDGSTAEVMASVAVADPGRGFDLVSQGPGAYAFDAVSGGLRRVDGTTFEVSQATTVLSPATGPHRILAAEGTLCLVDLVVGALTCPDSETLTGSGPVVTLATGLDEQAVAMDPSGQIWAVSDRGELIWATQGARHTRAGAASPGDTTVAIVGDTPVLIDPRRATAAVIDSRTGVQRRSLALDLRGDGVLRPAERSAERLHLTTSWGSLISCDLGGDVRQVTLWDSLAEPSGPVELGAPVEGGDLVFVPDHSSGRVWVVDPDRGRVVAVSPHLPSPAADGFQLVARDGVVFLNDPGSAYAGVVEPDGNIRPVTKYRPDPDLPQPPAGEWESEDSPWPEQSSEPDLGPAPVLEPLPGQTGPVTSPGPGGRTDQLPETTGPAETASPERSPSSTGSTVVGWGDDSEGQTRVPEALAGVVAVEAGYEHVAALRSDGTVVAWGDDSVGQTRVPRGLSGVTAIASGYHHTLALRSDGTVVAWGDDSEGQTRVPRGLSGVTAIAAGCEYSLALRSDGTVVAWGDDSEGQTTVPEDLAGVVAISAGCWNPVALRSDGTVVAWGATFSRVREVPAGLSEVARVFAGDWCGAALTTEGTLVTWGNQGLFQTAIPSRLSDVISIDFGKYHGVALRSDGTVVSWGNNKRGQATVPDGLSGVTAVSAGGWFSVALR